MSSPRKRTHHRLHFCRQMSALVVTFLAHLDVPNAGALVFASLETGTVVVQQLMLEQLQDAENDMHILKASQISVNAAVG